MRVIFSAAGLTAPSASWRSSSPSWPRWSSASSKPWASQAGASGKTLGWLGWPQGWHGWHLACVLCLCLCVSCLACERIQCSVVDTGTAAEEWFWGVPRGGRHHGRTQGKEALCLRSLSPEPWEKILLKHCHRPCGWSLCIR